MKVRKCPACKTETERSVLDSNYSICPACGHYMRFHAKKRLQSLVDKGSFKEWDGDLEWSNPLNDKEYAEKVEDASRKHNLKDAIITGEACIEGNSVAIGVMDTRFMMASMGQVVGERVTRLFERATGKKLPVILFCCSGGARMQEGIISLMQMEKTAAAVKRHDGAGLLYISVLTNPTMGGVTASFALIADIILAEKGAMIGFAGPRVIEQNTGVKLPEGFQTAEFQMDHGAVDDIVERANMRRYMGMVLKHHRKKRSRIICPGSIEKEGRGMVSPGALSAWQTVQRARATDRPTSLDYMEKVFDSFYELHGDRTIEDDHAIVGGIATICGTPVTVIGVQKGKSDIQEALYRNWGMPSPAGYRKALRLMKQAEKFGRPVICFVDTIGAACGKEAEEQGQGHVIARLLKEISTIKVPILSIIHGEGGSGGALALSVANEVYILEHAVYSILTPEGYASILWKDSKRAPEAVDMMKMTSKDLYDLQVVDKICAEPAEFDEKNMRKMCLKLKWDILMFLKKYHGKSDKFILNQRYERFRKF
ncbi:MAG: acetyl-CoA carboxylase, carboxyltransferase subunit beta [Lachnospiraceae bacterium]|nr:acetyl-CoA carboxylase, carboxyltransferase subunit beta [Lachnospiraceae bacterium]